MVRACGSPRGTGPVRPERKAARSHKSPDGKTGRWIVSGIAFLTSLLAIVVGFIPTGNVRAEGPHAAILYIAFLFFGSLFFVAAPPVLYHWSEKHPALQPDPAD